MVLQQVDPTALHEVVSSSSTHLQKYLASVSGVSELSYSDFKLAVADGGAVYNAEVAYVICVTSLVCIVTVLYAQKGLAVISRILVYLFALATMTISVKELYVTYGYNFPRFVTGLHLLCSGGVAFMIMFYRWRVDGTPIRFPTMQNLKTIIPTAICFASNIVVNNTALYYMGAGFVEMVAGCGPIFVFVITAVTHKFVDFNLCWPVVVVSVGTIMCVEGEHRFSYGGLALALLSNLLRALRSTMQDALMTSDTVNVHPMEPLELLAWLSVPSAAMMLAWSMTTEALQPFSVFYDSNPAGLRLALFISCCNAIILNFANIFVIKDIGALGANIVAQLKGILVILGSVAMLGEKVQGMQMLGYGTLVAGVFWYNNAEQSGKANTPVAETLPLKHERLA